MGAFNMTTISFSRGRKGLGVGDGSLCAKGDGSTRRPGEAVNEQNC
jgi:hypothetical protein